MAYNRYGYVRIISVLKPIGLVYRYARVSGLYQFKTLMGTQSTQFTYNRMLSSSLFKIASELQAVCLLKRLNTIMQ